MLCKGTGGSAGFRPWRGRTTVLSKGNNSLANLSRPSLQDSCERTSLAVAELAHKDQSSFALSSKLATITVHRDHTECCAGRHLEDNDSMVIQSPTENIDV